MTMIGREKEIALLQSILKKERSQFVAMYGRRRIGKTFLIRNVYAKHLLFECSGLRNGSLEQQLENFHLSLCKQSKTMFPKPSTWLQCFHLLENYLDGLQSARKKVIFLDEIPWFETHKGGFLAAFTNFWNAYCTKRNDIILVVCGSATSWIIDMIVNNRGGLHNRLNHHIRLDPFTLKECQLFLSNRKISFSPKDLALLYMCMGGIPFYLEEINQGESVAQIMNKLFLSPKALFRNEFDNLYHALFKHADKYIEVIKLLASKNRGLTRQEIVKYASFETGGGLTKILKELEACGFIDISSPIDKERSEAIHRLVDEYSFFYLKFLNGKEKYKTANELFNSQSFKVWTGYAFENLCLRHKSEIAAALGFSGISYATYSFVHKAKQGDNQKGTQIDLIFDRSDNVLNIIECKFYEGSYVMKKADADSVIQKRLVYVEKTASKKTIFTTLITIYPTERNAHYLSAITNELNIDSFLK